MAIRVDIDLDTVRRALEMAEASAARQLNSKTLNPKFKQIYQDDINRLVHARTSLTEVK